MHRLSPLAALLVVVHVVGCQGRPAIHVEPLPIPAGCSPLLHEHECGVRCTSDFFLVDDDTMPSGHRVALDGAAELFTTKCRSADITEFVPQDGFSRQPPSVWTFGVGAKRSCATA